MKKSTIIIVIIIILLSVFFVQRRGARVSLPKGETALFEEATIVTEEISDNNNIKNVDIEIGVINDISGIENLIVKTEKKNISISKPKIEKVILKSTRDIFVTDGVKHSIPLDEIRKGCFGRDCIPSVDDPEFVSIAKANEILPEDTVGIGLVYKGETRFYPFNMLVTKEIVNDVVAGDPLVVTYCPLCGTGIVFNRQIDGRIFEFGVSGMLWQSNLLMYNREEDEDKISLWSQVLGESVLGADTGVKLPIVRSDIVRYTDWRDSHPTSRVLSTGRIGDPYGGDYYRVARSFDPSFDESSSPIEPTTYVLGIEVDGKYKAYVKDSLKVGATVDEFNSASIVIDKSKSGEISVTNSSTGAIVSVIEGFWFSWVAVHPETELLK